MQAIKDRFMGKVEIITETGCWIWMASTLKPSAKKTGNQMPYGCFYIGGKTVSAHRASYLLFNGEIPAGKCVCHVCDTPLCVNPSHLFAGSVKDNVNDMVRKGRSRQSASHQFKRGALHHAAKLTLSQVEEIRRSKGSIRFIALKFNVAKDAIWKIRNGLSWSF